MRKIILIFLAFSTVLMSCKEDVLPKPKGYLSLSYPKNAYKTLDIERPYSFEVSTYAVVEDLENKWLKIEYPTLNASLHITYRSVQNNILELLTDSEKLVYEHAVKAEEIGTKKFENFERRVFGSMQEISGNAASQIQFHVTDSTRNFIKGSLYFYTKPNYDSILPAVAYIKKDVIRIVESLYWK